MNVTCPSCGAGMDLDVALVHEESRQAVAMLLALGMPLGKQVLQYLRLFKPAVRALSIHRFAAMLAELLPDIRRGAITHKGREWAAPPQAWSTAIERMLDGRDKLLLPMRNHAYLYEIVAGLADKVEAVDERRVEGERRMRSLADIGDAGVPQPVATVLHTAPPPAPVYAPGPSRYAKQLQADIATRQARKASTGDTPGNAPLEPVP